ncbi:MAG: nickel-type superoxide dismutase maturation protease [Acidimicrobiales bacterium]
MRRLVVVSVVGMLSSAVLGALGIGAAVLAGLRLGTRRVVVEGRSMVPALEPGDRLLVARLARWWPVRPGDVVAVSDPREPDRLLVKRVRTAGGGSVTLTGDNAAESTDSGTFGPVDRTQVWGRVVYRYRPSHRAGRVARRVPATR